MIIIITLKFCEIHFQNEINCVKELIYAQKRNVIISYQLLIRLKAVLCTETCIRHRFRCLSRK